MLPNPSNKVQNDCLCHYAIMPVGGVFYILWGNERGREIPAKNWRNDGIGKDGFPINHVGNNGAGKDC